MLKYFCNEILVDNPRSVWHRTGAINTPPLPWPMCTGDLGEGTRAKWCNPQLAKTPPGEAGAGQCELQGWPRNCRTRRSLSASSAFPLPWPDGDRQELWDGSIHSNAQAGHQELTQLTHIILWWVKVTLEIVQFCEMLHKNLVLTQD